MKVVKTLLAVTALSLPVTMYSQAAGGANAKAAEHTGAEMSAPAGQASAEQTVNAELRSAVDSKHAKAGDQVTAVTRQQSALGGTRLPKGTMLIGHVTDVRAHSKSNAEGTVSMVFDQARLKNGTTVPIHTTIRSLAPSAAAQGMAGDDMDMGATAMAPGAGAGMQSSGAVRGGGGLLGGARSTVGGVTNTTGAMVGSTVRGVGETTGAVANTAVRGASGIPGVTLSADAGANTSGTVSAPGHDVHLENGTQMTLGVSSR